MDKNEHDFFMKQLENDYLASQAQKAAFVGTPTALETQVGGSHYKKYKIQPVEFCHVNGIPYIEATAIKYLCRWRDKGGFDDLDKAIHFIQLLKQLESNK